MTDPWKSLSYLSLAISNAFYSKKSWHCLTTFPHEITYGHANRVFLSLKSAMFCDCVCKDLGFLPSSTVTLPLAPLVAVSKRDVRHWARPGRSPPNWTPVPGFQARSFPAQWQKSSALYQVWILLHPYLNQGTWTFLHFLTSDCWPEVFQAKLDGNAVGFFWQLLFSLLSLLASRWHQGGAHSLIKARR